MQVENKVNFVFEDQMIKLTQGKKKKEKPEVSNYAHGQTLTTGLAIKRSLATPSLLSWIITITSVVDRAIVKIDSAMKI